MIQLYTLGSLDLVDSSDGHQVLSVLAQPKRVGFLSYLALASPRGPHQRDTLLGIFWPDSTEKRARNALNQTAFVLRRALGQKLFKVNGEPRIAIDPEEIWCDVWEFEKALESGEKEEALDLYRGNFLEGFFLPGCLGFERWVDSERGRLRDLATGAVLSLTRDMERAGNPVGGVGWLRRGREWAPYDEVVLRRQMELLLALGDRSGAVREYESFSRRLSVDLGLEPSEQTTELLSRAPSVEGIWPSAVLGQEPSADPASTTRSPEDPGREGKRRFSLWQMAAVAALAILTGVGGTLGVSRLASLAPAALDPGPSGSVIPPRVSVLPMENATGDPELERLGFNIADEVRLELAGTGLASVASPDGANPGLGLVSDAEYLVTGTYSLRDGFLAIQTRILEAGTGAIVIVVDPVLGSLADPKYATERLKRRVAGALGMVLDPRLSDLARVASHPPSFEAYQVLADGLDVTDRLSAHIMGGTRAAMVDTAAEAFLRAAAHDSKFTLPLILNLESTYSDVDSVLQILLPMRDELPRWERAMLDYHLAGQSWDHVGQHHAMSRVVSMSADPEWKFRLARAACWANRPGEAVDLLSELEEERDWIEGTPYFWTRMGEGKLLLGDYEAVLNDVYHAQALIDDHPGLFILEVEALARLGRVEEAIARSIEVLESSGSTSRRFLSYSLPRALRAAGLEEPTRRVAEVGVATLKGEEQAPPGPLAATLVLAGRYEEAREVLTGFEEWTSWKGQAQNLMAYMAAREGDAEEANRLTMAVVSGGDPEEPRDPQRIMLQVETSAQLGDNAQAVRFLREAYGSGLAHGTWIYHNWDLRPLYGYKPYEDLMRPKG